MDNKIFKSEAPEWKVDDFQFDKEGALLLGEGLCGQVFKGKNKMTMEEVVIKVLHTDSEDFSDILFLLNVKHENIVRLFAMGQMSQGVFMNRHVIVMEYCCHKSLKEFLELKENCNGLDGVSYVTLMECIKNGYEFLKAQSLPQRDIKPENILVSENPAGNMCFKFADLLCAFDTRYGYKWKAPLNLTRTEFHWHPRVNAASSQLSATGTYIDTEYVEVWSMGITLYEAATGERAYLPFLDRRRNLKNALQVAYERSQPGVISMKEIDEGEWKQSTQLPENIRMPRSLAELVTPLIAQLMSKHRHQNKTVSCMEKFDQVMDLMKKELETLTVAAAAAATSMVVSLVDMENMPVVGRSLKRQRFSESDVPSSLPTVNETIPKKKLLRKERLSVKSSVNSPLKRKPSTTFLTSAVKMKRRKKQPNNSVGSSEEEEDDMNISSDFDKMTF